MAEDPLLRAGLLLVAPAAAEQRVEPVLVDRVEERRSSGAGCVDGSWPGSSVTRPASIEAWTEATMSRSPSSATRRSRNVERLREVVAGVDVDDREREAAGPERLLGQAQQNDRILAAAEQQRRPLEDGRGLAEDVDRLRLELGEVREAVALGVGITPRRRRRLGRRTARRRPRRAPSSAPSSRARVEVDPALALLGLLPPPAPGALVLAGLDRPGARRAADRRVAAVVEGVVGQVVLADVGPDPVARPVGERRDLPDRRRAADPGPLFGGLGAGRDLVAAKAGDPAVDRRERPPERLDLADVAALRAVLDRLVEEVQALGRGPSPRRAPRRGSTPRSRSP